MFAFTRRGFDWTDCAPAIVETMGSLRVRSVTLDGEAVVCAPTGATDFDRLRSALFQGSPEAFLYAFDLLELDGTDVRSWPGRPAAKPWVRVLRTHVASTGGRLIWTPRDSQHHHLVIRFPAMSAGDSL